MKSNEVDDACLPAMRKIAPMDFEIFIRIKKLSTSQHIMVMLYYVHAERAVSDRCDRRPYVTSVDLRAMLPLAPSPD